MLIDSSNKRCDKVVKELCELKTSLQFTQKDADDVKTDLAKLTEDLKLASGESHSMSESLRAMTEKAEYLEGQARRNNLVFEGIQESTNERWTETEEKVKALFKEKLQLPGDIALEWVVRMTKRNDSTPVDLPRPVVASFLRFKDRSAVLESAKKLRGTNIFINEDFTEAVRQRRRELLPALKAARSRGEIAYLRYDKLITHPANTNKKE